MPTVDPRLVLAREAGVPAFKSVPAPPAGAIAELLPHVRGAAIIVAARLTGCRVVVLGRRRYLVPGRGRTLVERVLERLARPLEV